MKKRKGIVLAGGTGSRLYPVTSVVSKQLLPVFDKPMIYYPISVLIQAGIREILVITTPDDQTQFQDLLGNGAKWGITIAWEVQQSPDGLACALLIAEKFLDGSPSALILGDNLFYGSNFSDVLMLMQSEKQGATVFGYQVSDPSRYGVVEFDSSGRVISITEKPETPSSNYAVTGLYFYDENAPKYAKNLEPSKRGELEITALNEVYLRRSELQVELLDSGTTWLDTGTSISLLAAAQFVAVIEERQGIKICSPEVEAFRKGWINSEDLMNLAAELSTSGYGKYLEKVAQSRLL